MSNPRNSAVNSEDAKRVKGPRSGASGSSMTNIAAAAATASAPVLVLPHDATFDTADTHAEHDEDYEEEAQHDDRFRNKATSRSYSSLHPKVLEEGRDGLKGDSRRVAFSSSEDDGDNDDQEDGCGSELPTQSPTRPAGSSSPSNWSSDDNDNDSNRKSSKRNFACVSDDWHDYWIQAVYVSVFGILGSVLRVYLGRFFGLDCHNSAVSDDWFTRISESVCVTTNGKTDQTGGALFTDLPANMVGCFVMGLICPAVSLRGNVHPIPWFRQDHPLQRHPAFLLALRVGFCGCLTTFASWNTQMVVMLDGTDTQLGSQVVAGLAGYLMGVCTSIMSFLCGRHAYDAWVTLHNPVLPRPDSADAGIVVVTSTTTSSHNNNDDDDAIERGGGVEAMGSSEHSSDVPLKQKITLLSQWGRLWSFVAGIRVMPFLLVSGMTAGFVVGDAVYGKLFYRKMWMCVLLSPCGALLRWHLSRYNSAGTATSNSSRWAWVPWGTVAANMTAVVVSVLAEALEDRYAVPGAPGYAWISTALPAVETGFAGSLSTVSTFVREMVDLNSTPSRMYLYGFGSLTVAMLLGLLVYSPIIRYL